MKEKIKDIALQVGGSHYPTVGGELLQKFAEMVIAECIDAVNQADVRSIVFTTFDNAMANDVKLKSIESIKARFNK